MTATRLGRPRAATPTRVVLAVLLLTAGAFLLSPGSALAAISGGASGSHAGFLPFSVPIGSIFSITDDLSSIAKDIFKAFVNALMPPSLTKDGIALLTWLAALPSTSIGSTYGGVGQLEQDMRDVAFALMPLTLTITAIRYTVSGLTGSTQHPAHSIVRVASSCLFVLMWSWFFNNVTAFINVLSSTIFKFSDVHHGLTALWATMFAGSASFGAFSAFAEILILVAIALVIGLIIVKVAILVLLSFLFVIGPVAIMLSPIPELSALTKLFGAVFMAAALIPIGWALMFALTGAFIGSTDHVPVTFNGIADDFMSLCAGLLCLAATIKWPTFIVGFAKSRVGGLVHQIGGGAAGGVTSSGAAGGRLNMPQRALAARTALEAGGSTFARSLGAIGGAMGMPGRGPAGAALTAPKRLFSRGSSEDSSADQLSRSWSSLLSHGRSSLRSTPSRAAAAAKRGATVATHTPTAVAASMGLRKAQARVSNANPATGAKAKDGPSRIDRRWGDAHLANAHAAAQGGGTQPSKASPGQANGARSAQSPQGLTTATATRSAPSSSRAQTSSTQDSKQTRSHNGSGKSRSGTSAAPATPPSRPSDPRSRSRAPVPVAAPGSPTRPDSARLTAAGSQPKRPSSVTHSPPAGGRASSTAPSKPLRASRARPSARSATPKPTRAPKRSAEAKPTAAPAPTQPAAVPPERPALDPRTDLS